MKLLNKNEILIAMLCQYQGHGYFLTVTKTRQQHSLCMGRRMTGHNIVIMTDNCSFLFLLEAGAGGNNQY